MRKSLLAFCLVVISLTGGATLGEESEPYYPVPSIRRNVPPEAPHHHSSTVIEGARRGQAVLVTAYGEFLVDEALAATIWESARSMHYDNELKKTATALSRKIMLADYQQLERQRQYERQIQSRYLWQLTNERLARAFRLNEYQLNWDTGAIYWPASFAGPRYAEMRKRLGELLARVVRYNGKMCTYDIDEIARISGQFQRQLRDDFTEGRIPVQQEYSDMRRFIVGLKYAPYTLPCRSTRPTSPHDQQPAPSSYAASASGRLPSGAAVLVDATGQYLVDEATVALLRRQALLIGDHAEIDLASR